MGCGAGEKAVGRDPSAFAPRAQLKIPHLARSLARWRLCLCSALALPCGRQPSQGSELMGPSKSPASDAAAQLGPLALRFAFLGLVPCLPIFYFSWCLAYFRTCQTVNYKVYKKNWV